MCSTVCPLRIQLHSPRNYTSTCSQNSVYLEGLQRHTRSDGHHSVSVLQMRPHLLGQGKRGGFTGLCCRGGPCLHPEMRDAACAARHRGHLLAVAPAVQHRPNPPAAWVEFAIRAAASQGRRRTSRSTTDTYCGLTAMKITSADLTTCSRRTHPRGLFVACQLCAGDAAALQDVTCLYNHQRGGGRGTADQPAHSLPASPPLNSAWRALPAHLCIAVHGLGVERAEHLLALPHPAASTGQTIVKTMHTKR